MGVGTATGENRAKEAALQAIASPLLDVSMQGATGVLFAVAGGDDLGMLEVQEAAQTITENAAPDAKIIFGTINDNSMRKGVVKVTVIATGFPPNNAKPESIFSFGSKKKKDDETPPKTERAATLSFVPEAQAARFTQDNDTANDRSMPVPARTKKDEPTKTEDIPDDDDWSAIPSFLRRSKIK